MIMQFAKQGGPASGNIPAMTKEPAKALGTLRVLTTFRSHEVTERIERAFTIRNWEPQVRVFEGNSRDVVNEVLNALVAGAPYDLVVLDESGIGVSKQLRSAAAGQQKDALPHVMLVSTTVKNLNEAIDVKSFYELDSIVLYTPEDELLPAHISQLAEQMTASKAASIKK